MAVVSRQRKYQLKRKKEGKCQTCGAVAFRAGECRRHYVLRAMRRLDPQNAEVWTRRILQTWLAIETLGLSSQGYDSSPPKTVRRWSDRWVARIGGNS